MEAEIIITLGIAVVLPIAIVWLCQRARISIDNNKAEILKKALESNSIEDVDRIIAEINNSTAPAKQAKSLRRLMINRLLAGCILTFIGISVLFSGMLVFNFGNSYLALFLWIVGGILLATGLGFLVVYLVMRKMPEAERVEEN